MVNKTYNLYFVFIISVVITATTLFASSCGFSPIQANSPNTTKSPTKSPTTTPTPPPGNGNGDNGNGNNGNNNNGNGNNGNGDNPPPPPPPISNAAQGIINELVTNKNSSNTATYLENLLSTGTVEKKKQEASSIISNEKFKNDLQTKIASADKNTAKIITTLIDALGDQASGKLAGFLDTAIPKTAAIKLKQKQVIAKLFSAGIKLPKKPTQIQIKNFLDSILYIKPDKLSQAVASLPDTLDVTKKLPQWAHDNISNKYVQGALKTLFKDKNKRNDFLANLNNNPANRQQGFDKLIGFITNYADKIALGKQLSQQNFSLQIYVGDEPPSGSDLLSTIIEIYWLELSSENNQNELNKLAKFIKNQTGKAGSEWNKFIEPAQKLLMEDKIKLTQDDAEKLLLKDTEVPENSITHVIAELEKSTTEGAKAYQKYLNTHDKNLPPDLEKRKNLATQLISYNNGEILKVILDKNFDNDLRNFLVRLLRRASNYKFVTNLDLGSSENLANKLLINLESDKNNNFIYLATKFILDNKITLLKTNIKEEQVTIFLDILKEKNQIDSTGNLFISQLTDNAREKAYEWILSNHININDDAIKLGFLNYFINNDNMYAQDSARSIYWLSIFVFNENKFGLQKLVKDPKTKIVHRESNEKISILEILARKLNIKADKANVFQKLAELLKKEISITEKDWVKYSAATRKYLKNNDPAITILASYEMTASDLPQDLTENQIYKLLSNALVISATKISNLTSKIDNKQFIFVAYWIFGKLMGNDSSRSEEIVKKERKIILDAYEKIRKTAKKHVLENSIIRLFLVHYSENLKKDIKTSDFIIDIITEIFKQNLGFSRAGFVLLIDFSRDNWDINGHNGNLLHVFALNFPDLKDTAQQQHLTKLAQHMKDQLGLDQTGWDNKITSTIKVLTDAGLSEKKSRKILLISPKT